MIRAGIVGLGYWGRKIARAMSDHPDLVVTHVYDPHVTEPGFSNSRSVERLCNDVEAVVVTSPPSTHFGALQEILGAHRDVLVAKPMVASVEEAEWVRANRGDCVVMVDHTFVYSPAVRAAEYLCLTGEQVGKLRHITGERTNLGSYQESDVIVDLLPHDLSIIHAVTDDWPVAVSAQAYHCAQAGVADTAHVALYYDDGLAAHLHLSWFHPAKLRRMVFAGTKRMLVYDDTEASEKIREYDRGVDVSEARVNYRTGPVRIPYLDPYEPLALMVDHFAKRIRDRLLPWTNAEHGWWEARVLEACRQSVLSGGQVIPL